MSKIIIIAGACICLLFCVSCFKNTSAIGNSSLVEKSYSYKDFDKIIASAAFKITLQQGNSYQVLLKIDPSIEKNLDVREENRTLYLGYKTSFTVFGMNTHEAIIQLPDLASLELSGACSLQIAGQLELAHDLLLELSGASSASGTITGRNVTCRLSGASNLVLNGSGAAIDVIASGASKANLVEYRVTDAKIDINGASKADVQVDGNIALVATGASQFRYKGKAILTRSEISGASTIKQLQ